MTRREHETTSTPLRDVNAATSFLLQDLASVQPERQKRYGYERAAFAIFGLDEPLPAIWAHGALARPIFGVGPSSSRIIREVMETGGSPTVEQAVDAAGKRAEIDKRRALQTTFLSRSAVRTVLADASLPGPRLDDYRGDLQMHSDWSDGSMTIDELVRACAGRGYRFSAVTDHSHGLPIAGGVSMADVADQHRQIDDANSKSADFHLFKGIEANITADGLLDLSADEAAVFDLVLAAPHAKLRTADDQTARMLTAIELPYTRILAHPRGRKAGTRAGVVVNWDRVFSRAAELGVAIEIDGDPSRQDLDYTLARRALEAGCLFALDSDAHSPRELVYAETAIAHARLAGIPAERIVNCWHLDRFRQWLAAPSGIRRRRRAGARRPAS